MNFSAESIGDWWFRHRSLSPLPWLFLVLVLPPNFPPSLLTFSLAAAVIIAAELIRMWAVGYAGSATRTRCSGVPDLIHAGPYRFIRNPLYVANILMYVSAGVAFGFSYLAIAIGIYSCVQYSFIVRYEENLLTGVFGQRYEKYRAQVPRWFAVCRSIESSAHSFDLKRALRSERSTLCSLLAMALLFVAKVFIVRA